MTNINMSPARPFIRRSTSIVALAISALLTGCAVIPNPITQAERSETLKADRLQLFTNQEAVTGPITLEEAMARTIKYNLDHRVKMLEQAMALGQADVARFDMLPRLVANAGYVTRNNYLVSDSMYVDTGEIVPSTRRTTSQERERNTADLNFTWNALDFGVSYFQAHQQANRSLILAERQRKTVHQLMHQVRQAYWLAVGAEALESQVAPLLFEVREALSNAEAVEREQLRPPLETLNYRKAMLDIVRQLEAMRDELRQAKPKLANLMNLPPATQFKLDLPTGPLLSPKLQMTLEQMEEQALLQRPELIEADLQERIGILETRKALVRMLPGIEIFAGPHYDSNRFLANNNWTDAGLRVTWNLLNLLSGPKQIQLAEDQTEVSRMQRLALNIAILTQVHVAWQDYNARERQYALSQEIFTIDEKIHGHTKAAVDINAQNKLNQIRSGVTALMSEYRRYQSYAAMQSSYGQLIATLGSDPLPLAGLSDKPVAELAKLLTQVGSTSGNR